MSNTPKLHVERVEDRTVPTVFGNTWIDPNLTVSYTPDGTDVGGVGSSLFATLGKRATEQEWKAAVRAAFQTWTGVTNLTTTVTADDGRAIGTPGPVQGSPHVGDIRITARPLSDNVLAVATPFDLASSWAGEIVLNSNKLFDTDGSAGAYDLRTVLLHEIGHSLGLPGSADPTSVMSAYTAPRATLSAGDVAAIQALYGRPAEIVSTLFGTADQTFQSAAGQVTGSTDWAAGVGTNDTASTATALGRSRDTADKRWDFAGVGHLASRTDVDVFRVQTKEKQDGGVMVVYVGTAVGGVAPRVTITDSSGKVVPAEVLMNDGEAMIVQVQNVKKNATFQVSVSAADRTKWTGRERYHMGVDFRSQAVTLTSVATGTFTAAQPVFARTLVVHASQGFRFQLRTDGRAELSVYDVTRKKVFNLVAEPGQTTFDQVILPPGEYTVAIRGKTGVRYHAGVLATTDPIGLDAPADPTLSPAPPRTAPPPSTFRWMTYAQSYYAWLL
jgi:hypothetical protein